MKTQHNVGLLYTTPKLEPLSSLFKPHVRKLGQYLGVPDEILFGIPCPGPAQLLRVGGEFTNEKLQIAKIATDVVEQMTNKYCKEIWGEEFDYDETTGIRRPFQMFGGVTDSWRKGLDGLSHFANTTIPAGEIKCYKMKTRTTYIEKGLKRSEPITMPILWLESEMEQDHEDLLDLSNAMWDRFGYPRVFYQVYDSGRSKGYPVFIRVVESEDAVTAKHMKIGFAYLQRMGKRIAERSPEVTKVAYDMSVKPPSTIEII